VGVDVGTKRVGLAQSDPLRMFAQPIGAYSPSEAIEVLKKLNESEGIEILVIGWPLEEDGSEGKATGFVRAYEERLKSNLGRITVQRWDERYTSIMAKEAILHAGAGRKARRDRGRVDAAAAAIILQEYLGSLQDNV